MGEIFSPIYFDLKVLSLTIFKIVLKVIDKSEVKPYNNSIKSNEGQIRYYQRYRGLYYGIRICENKQSETEH